VSQATVLALINAFGFEIEGVPQINGFYADLMWDAARWGVATSVQLVPTVRGTDTYAMPDTEGKRYMLFYDDIQLSVSSIMDLAAVNPDWRDERGRPDAYVTQDESEHDIPLYPVPDVNARDFVFLFGSPMGRDFPDRAIGAVMGERRDDLPSWLDVPLALGVLAREYERESDHRDVAFAGACRQMSNNLLAMVLA
jgi:hypothetical protein